MRFLIVDDSSTMRRIIINTLNKLGHQEVQEAGNGKDGLERLGTLRRQAIHAGNHAREDRGRAPTVMPMPPVQIETQFVDELFAATRDVFKTMVFHEVETSAPISDDALRPGANVVGTVAFAGKTSGRVVFYSTLEGAQAITASMVGVNAGDRRGL